MLVRRQFPEARSSLDYEAKMTPESRAYIEFECCKGPRSRCQPMLILSKVLYSAHDVPDGAPEPPRSYAVTMLYNSISSETISIPGERLGRSSQSIECQLSSQLRSQVAKSFPLRQPALEPVGKLDRH